MNHISYGYYPNSHTICNSFGMHYALPRPLYDTFDIMVIRGTELDMILMYQICRTDNWS